MHNGARPAKVAQQTEELPARIGRYEVLMRLGVGGMATVYLARAVGEAGFERLVALKVLHSHLLAEEEFLSMFLDEARVAARIHHPNVVAIQDLGVDGERMYTVMDYVQGDTLAAAQQTAIRLRRGLPLPVVLRVALDALHGLDAAHDLVDASGRSLQVVHRDVTPHNVLVGTDGVSRVTDFGIAKAESRLSFTDVGTLKGKAPYMAPEQFAARRIDRRADLFAMAVTIWEAIALRRCFPTDLSQGARRPPYRPLTSILPMLPPALDAVLARALRNDPNERWRTAGEFAEAIERPLRDHVATHRDVAAFARAFARAKVDREREAIARPSKAPLRGRSGFQSAAVRPASVAPAPDLWGPRIDTTLRDEETEAPTRVSPQRVPTKSARLGTPVSLPPPALLSALRGATLLGPGDAKSSCPPPPSPGEADPAGAFVSIPAPSIAPPSMEALRRAEGERVATVLDPDASGARAAVREPSLINPEIPKAPKMPAGLSVPDAPPTPAPPTPSEIPELSADDLRDAASEAPPDDPKPAPEESPLERSRTLAQPDPEPAPEAEAKPAPEAKPESEVKPAPAVIALDARKPLQHNALVLGGGLAAAAAIAAALWRMV